MIPKIIHYCWLSGDPVPKSLQLYMASWQKYLPDYEFILWDLNRFDINQSNWVKQAFEAKKYAFAADYIRLYAVYNHGGFYMDMDVEVVKSLDPLLDGAYALAIERPDGGIEAGVFGAEKGSEIVEKCLAYYNNRDFIMADGSFNIKVLPKIMHEAIDENYTIKERHSAELVFDRDVVELFSQEYFTSNKNGMVNKTSKSYTIHHFAGSWLPMSRKIERSLKYLLRKTLGNKIYDTCKSFFQ